MVKKNKKHSDNLKTSGIDLQKIGIIITRPRAQSEFLVQSIENSNGVAFTIPCLEICEPLNIETAQKICTESAIDANYWAFTSPNSVEYAQKFGLDFNVNKPCISIGAGTTKLLKKLTTAEIIQGDKPYTSEKLLEKLETLPLDDQKISIFSGEGGRRLLADAMSKLGADAHYVDVYRRIKPDHIDLTHVITYSENHPLIILVSSQEAFENYHQEAITHDPNALKHTLIAASERLVQFAQSLGYTKIYLANSALGQDLWQKVTEIYSIIEDSSMTQLNDKDNPDTLEEDSPVEHYPPVKTPEPQNKSAKQSHSLSYMALALGAIGIGIGAFAFLQISQESTNTRNLYTTIEAQKSEITTLTTSLNVLQNSLDALKKSVDAERGQSTDFTNLVDAQNQQNQNFQALQQRLATLDTAITNLQADSGTSVNRYNQLQDHLNEFQEIVGKLDQSINQIGKMANDTQGDAIKIQNRLTSQLVDVNSKVASLTTLEDRLSAATDVDLLNLSQASYLLRLVNFKLMFEKDTQEAALILNQASDRLMATANTKFSETNNLIQSEIIKLKEIPTINHAEHATRLQNLTNIIPSLNTKSDDILAELKNTFKTEANNSATQDDTETKPWYKNVADKVKPVFVISQERTEAPDLMTVTDEALLKQSVQLQLSTARLALLQNQAETYQESLKTARTLLVKYFSQEDDQYHQTLSAVDDLLNVNILTENLNIIPILKSFEASMLNYRGEGL